MNRKNIKEFLRPNWKKIILMIIINLFFLYYTYVFGWFPKESNFYNDFIEPILFRILFIVQPAIVIRDLIASVWWESSWWQLTLGFVIGLIYQYVLISLIVWIYDKVKKK